MKLINNEEYKKNNSIYKQVYEKNKIRIEEKEKINIKSLYKKIKNIKFIFKE